MLWVAVSSGDNFDPLTQVFESPWGITGTAKSCALPGLAASHLSQPEGQVLMINET
jgi:hypothetical protein